jgi:hypothetical protein
MAPTTTTEDVVNRYDKMNPEVKAAWVAALRSGERQQDVGSLRTENGYCCLGVLCDLHAKATGGYWNGPPSTFSGRYRYLNDSSTLPSIVRDWADLPDGNPIIGEAVAAEDGQFHDYPAATFNDEFGYTFNQIADLIEENL